MLPPAHPTFSLSHITDMYLLPDQAVPEFQRALPAIAAMFRVCEHAFPGQLRSRFERLSFSTQPCDNIDWFGQRIHGAEMVQAARDKTPAPAVRQTYRLSHITDLATLADEHIEAFRRDIPTLVSTLRLAAQQADVAGDGPLLSSVLPHITFAPDLGDVLVLRTDESTRVLEGEDVRAASRTSTRRKARP